MAGTSFNGIAVGSPWS